MRHQSEFELDYPTTMDEINAGRADDDLFPDEESFEYDEPAVHRVVTSVLPDWARTRHEQINTIKSKPSGFEMLTDEEVRKNYYEVGDSILERLPF
jgi:hypothetical protein